MNPRSNIFRAGIVLAVSSVLVLAACQKKEATTASTPATPPAPAKSESEAQKATDMMAKMATDAKKEGDALVASAQKDAADKVAKAEAAAAKATAEADAAKAAAADKIAAVQKEAAEMLAKYSAEIESLKTGALAVKKIIDQNASLLPAGVQAKYKELDALLPQVTSLVGSLKGYQGTDLNNIVSKIQTDLGSAQKLYGEIRGLLPANLSAMLPKG